VHIYTNAHAYTIWGVPDYLPHYLLRDGRRVLALLVHIDPALELLVEGMGCVDDLEEGIY
jgi:hypothetical protein